MGEVAVIKHDGHDFTPDVPGTDSHRMKAAGAFGTVVYSERGFAWSKKKQSRQKISLPVFQRRI